MKTDHRHSPTGWLGPLLASVLGLGCGIVDPGSGMGAAADDVGTQEPSFSASPLLEPSSPTILFEDAAADGRGLTVVDLGADRLGVMVNAPIGTTLPMAPQGSLADLYRAIHPDAAELPVALLRADSTATDMRRRWDSNRRSEFLAEEPGSVLIEKSQTTFNNALCHDFSDGPYIYSVQVCSFALGWIATTYDGSAPHAYSLRCYDRSYAWNNSGTAATVEWLQVHTAFWGTVTWTLPAFTWSWFSVYCSDSNVRFSAEIVNGGPNPELGITWHVPIIP